MIGVMRMGGMMFLVLMKMRGRGIGRGNRGTGNRVRIDGWLGDWGDWMEDNEERDIAMWVFLFSEVALLFLSFLPCTGKAPLHCCVRASERQKERV